MKTLLISKRLIIATIFVLCGICSAFAEQHTVTYSASGFSTMGTWNIQTSGDAPEGSSATCQQTHGTIYTMTATTNITLTLTGYEGMRITGLQMEMASNASSGAGYLDANAGDKVFASIGSPSSGVSFSDASWNGKYANTWTLVTASVTPTVVGEGENVVVKVGCTVNSLYLRAFTITYEDGGLSTPNLTIDDITMRQGETRTLSVTTNSDASPVFNIKSGGDKVSLNGDELTAVAGGEAVLNVSLVETSTYAALSKDVNVTVLPTYTATFYSDGVAVADPLSYAEGEQVVFPSDPTPRYPEYSFVGWSTVPVATTNTEPVLLNSCTMGAANKVFYAVYAHGGEAYVKVTDASTLASGDKIVIVGSNQNGTAFAAKAYDGRSTNYASSEVTISDDKITSLGDACVFTLGGQSGAWTFYDGTYYVCNASNSSSTYAMIGYSQLHDYSAWQISLISQQFVILSKNNSTNPYMRFNASSQFFSCYPDQQRQYPVTLYRKESSYSDYTTTPVMTTFDLNVSSVGYATLCLPFNAHVPSGVQLFTARSEAEKVTLVEPQFADVCAGAGYIVKAPAGKYTFNATNDEVESPADNSLVGVTEDETLTGDETIYIFALDNGVVGFSRLVGTGNIPANKAYLKISSPLNSRETSVFSVAE